MQTHKPIIICGATASGKTALALQLAYKFKKRNGPACKIAIINADSRQVFQEIPILSAQPRQEDYALVPHHLFGIIRGDENYNVAIWLEQVLAILPTVDQAIIVGGSGMYLHALLYGLAPIPEIPPAIRERVRNMSQSELVAGLAEKADGNTNRMRRNLEVKLATGKFIDAFHSRSRDVNNKSFHIIHLNVSRETLYSNINARFLRMVEAGAIAEVETLLLRGYPESSSIMKTVGVQEIKSFLAKDKTLEQMAAESQQRSRNYAKRQLTWFRNQLRENKIEVASLEQGITLFE